MISKRGANGAALATAALFVWALSGAGAASADHQVTELVSMGPAGGNAAVDVAGFRISSDGAHSFVLTEEALVAADTDAERDVYRRSGGQTTLLSTGPSGGNGPFPVRVFDIDGDGSAVMFSTAERLTSADADDQVDLYRRSGGATTLVSAGPAGGNGPFGVESNGMSANGSSIVFETTESLTATDTNSVHDFYLWRGGQATLLTEGPVTNREFARHYVGMSADGRRVFFSTPRDLTGTDDDGAIEDTYKWEDGVVTIESVGTNGENGAGSVQNFTQRIDETGSRLIFFTTSALDPAYEEGGLFERANGVTRLVSVGPNGPASLDISSVHPAAEGISADGSTVFIDTTSRLVDADTDSEQDLYARRGGTTRLLTTGPIRVLEPDFTIQSHQALRGLSRDGRRAVFSTPLRLTPEDEDGKFSLYENVDGETRWLSPFGLPAAVSPDGTRVFITTFDALSPLDTDAGPDLYEIHDGQIRLITAAGGGDPCMRDFGHPIVISCPISISRDGRRVLFWHSGQLLPGDTDIRYDVYLATAPPHRDEYDSAGAFCEAEREFLGGPAFRDRYGKGRKGKNAFKKCVRANR